MSSLRPGQTLSRCHGSSTTRATLTAVFRYPFSLPCRSYHPSRSRAAPPRPRFSSKPLKTQKIESPEAMQKFVQERFPEMRPEDLEGYTKAQIEAIKAGEEAIAPKDFLVQGRARDDKGRVEGYVDDFATIFPRIDVKPEPEWTRNRKIDFETHQELIETLERGGKAPPIPFNEEELATYRKAARSYDDFYRAIRDRKLDDMVRKKAETLTGPEKTTFLRAMERVQVTKTGEIDLTEDELKDMEAFPELAEKYLVQSGKGTEQVNKLDEETDPNSLFEYDARMAVMEEEADRLEALETKSQEQQALLKEIRYVTRKKRSENLNNQDDDELVANIKHLALAPPLGKVPGVEGLYKHQSDPEDEGLDDEGTFEFLKKTTGLTVRDILSIFTKVLVVRNVVNQTRLGKVRSASVMVIAGNGNGRIGLGIAKSADQSLATMAAKMLAIRNMKPIRRYENRTIYGNVREKVSGTIIELRARPPGYGLRLPSRLFEICRAAGIHDISGVIPRSRNPMNTVKATFQCLMNQPDPEKIAIGRGKKMVDVRRVYYGGAVY